MREDVICCYCARKTATTRDHIPPKAIFIKPRPADLITVPACKDCNSAASIHDEKFKVYLGLHVARFRKKGEILFKQGVIPTVRHNQRLAGKIINGVERIPLLNQNGSYWGNVNSILWDSESHDSVIERITRGLFYHHYERPVKSKSYIDVHWYRQLPDVDRSKLYKVSIGNGDFVYEYNKIDGADTDDSIWLYQFYDGHWSGALIHDRLQSHALSINA